MKKIYLIAGLFFASAMGFGQRIALPGQDLPFEIKTVADTRAVSDTITSHFVGATPTLYPSVSSGWLAGHNEYEDLAKMQKITTTTGGTITSLLFWFGAKEGNPISTITATIWKDTSGTPGIVVGSVAVPFSAIDTSMAGLTLIPNAAYNTVATFANPIPIPAGNTFWAGFSVTYLTGDSVGLVTSRDTTWGDAPGVTGDFPNANTQTFDQYSDSSFHSVNDGTQLSWQLDIAFAVFPVISPNTGIQTISQREIRLLQNQPNPASDHTVINYELNSLNSVSLKVFNVAGKEVLHFNEGLKAPGLHSLSLNTGQLSSGVYYYTLLAGEKSMTKKMIIIKYD